MAHDISVEDRLDLSEMFIRYCGALDTGEPAEAITAFYTSDGVLDNSAVGSPVVAGHEGLLQVFAGMQQAMDGMEHYLSNFLVLSEVGSEVSASCYVQAQGRPKGGDPFAIRGKYQITATLTEAGWKLAKLVFQPAG